MQSSRVTVERGQRGPSKKAKYTNTPAPQLFSNFFNRSAFLVLAESPYKTYIFLENVESHCLKAAIWLAVFLWWYRWRHRTVKTPLVRLSHHTSCRRDFTSNTLTQQKITRQVAENIKTLRLQRLEILRRETFYFPIAIYEVFSDMNAKRLWQFITRKQNSFSPQFKASILVCIAFY